MPVIVVTARAASPYSHVTFTHSVRFVEGEQDIAELIAYGSVEDQIADFEMYLEPDATHPDFDIDCTVVT